jgi:menaquinone-specific isochorismate synthase
MLAGPIAAPVTVRSEKITDPGPLLDLLPEPSAVAWIRGGDGFVGWGQAARVEFVGPHRFERADAWWQAYLAATSVEDEVGIPGSGPLAIASFSFADQDSSPAGTSVLVVPRVVIGRRNGVAWRTVVGRPHPQAPVTPPRHAAGARLLEDPAAVDAWRSAVASAVSDIRSGDLAKVVLALAMDAEADEPIDGRDVLSRLTERYPDCWGFLVDGLVGATPELLVERVGGQVRSRILAGTIPRTGDDCDDAKLSAALLASEKDLDEHRLAAGPVAERLARHCSSLTLPDEPSLLQLPNLLHLATEMTGRLHGDTTALGLAGDLHPTPAVAGTPSAAALRRIARLETADRGRYAGPVGWMDAHGDGEFCLALRCAQVSGSSARLFAGCGIVAESDPDTEVAEWRAKLRPVQDALLG